MLQPIKDKSKNILVTYPRKSRLAIVLLVVSILTFTPLIDWFLQFFIGGTVPGTSLTIPYWIMFTGYIGALMLIALVVIEDFFYTHEAVKKHMTKRRATKRHYSHS